MLRTINVSGDKIKVEMKKSFHLGNFNGYRGNVNGVKMYFMVMSIQEAMSKAFARYVKKYR